MFVPTKSIKVIGKSGEKVKATSISETSEKTYPDVVLIGYQDQGNLGMGYLAAVLQQKGHTIEMIDVRDGPEQIAARVITHQPLVIGFSLIFQFFLPQFRRVATFLRNSGVTSHF